MKLSTGDWVVTPPRYKRMMRSKVVSVFYVQKHLTPETCGHFLSFQHSTHNLSKRTVFSFDEAIRFMTTGRDMLVSDTKLLFFNFQHSAMKFTSEIRSQVLD
jgi:hypothetical protein